MKKVTRIGMIAVLAVAAVAAPAFAGDVSVGRFYKELAQAKHLVSVDATSAEASLRGAGFGLPALPLYRVRFVQRQVWPDYAGAPGDTVDIEIYEHWLEPA